MKPALAKNFPRRLLLLDALLVLLLALVREIPQVRFELLLELLNDAWQLELNFLLKLVARVVCRGQLLLNRVELLPQGVDLEDEGRLCACGSFARGRCRARRVSLSETV